MNRPRSRRILALLLAVAFLAPAAPVHAQDTTAVAVNTRDFAEVFRLAFHIQRVMSDTVDQSNAAVAYASCTECETIAISIQALLVMSDASVVTPENLALAMNVDCFECQTLASAYQFVLGFGEPVRFTDEGARQVADIRRRLEQLRTSGLSIVEVQQQVDALMQEFSTVLQNEVVPAGPEPAETSAPAATPAPEDTSTPAPEATAEATDTPTAEATPAPEETATPEPTPEATPEATATPEQTATPEPTPEATTTP